jgi:hypothetical protein
LAPEGDVNREKIKSIFREEIVHLKSASEAEMRRATNEIMAFIPEKVLSDSAPEGTTEVSRAGGRFVPAGRETLR